MTRGKTFIVSGPSGVGKSTVLKALMEKRKNLYFSISATTREARPGEIDGVHYHFISVDDFRDWISRDEAVVDTYRSEPKTSFDFTLNGYYNLFYSMLWLKKEEHLRRMRKDLPVLFASGTADPVGSYGKGVEAAAESFRAHGVTHVDVKLYPADRHEILNELDRQQVYEDLWRWMEENRIP